MSSKVAIDKVKEEGLIVSLSLFDNVIISKLRSKQ